MSNNSCTTTVSDKILVFKDKNPKSKSIFIINNAEQRQIERHEVDGCLIKGSESKKCDWLAVDVKTKIEVYIELKGEAVADGVKQLCASVEQLSKEKKAKKLGYIICSRSPLTSAEIQKKAKQVLQSHQLILRVKPSNTETCIKKLMADLKAYKS